MLFYFKNITQLITFSVNMDFVKLFTFTSIAVIICWILGMISLIISTVSIFELQKAEQYECGFDPFDNAPERPFNVHFYIIGVLFLIFDVEVAFLFPWIFGLNSITLLGFYTMFIFITILFIGFYYEWKKGALKWLD